MHLPGRAWLSFRGCRREQRVRSPGPAGGSERLMGSPGPATAAPAAAPCVCARSVDVTTALPGTFSGLRLPVPRAPGALGSPTF